MIFISYAKEDQLYAHELFVALHEKGLAPWMDKPPNPYQALGLQVGQRWEPILLKKLGQADYIILLLSPRSISKRGYVQIEFRTALHRMNYLPQDEVLVLPILVEPCEVPALSAGQISLQDLQWDVVEKSNIESFAASLAARFGEHH